jgi:hypothetical protein
MKERANDLINNKYTTIMPIKEEWKNNIITEIGMRKSIDRDITDSLQPTLDWLSVGTSASAELVTQTQLVAEDSGGSYARRKFSTTGTRSRLNQTMKLGATFNDSQVSGVPITLKEAGVHWAVSGDGNMHARVIFSDFILNTGDLFVAQINELQENGVL